MTKSHDDEYKSFPMTKIHTLVSHQLLTGRDYSPINGDLDNDQKEINSTGKGLLTSLSERFATISDDYGNSTGKGLLTSLSERFATISDDYGNSTGKGLLTSLSERFATISDDYGNSTGKGLLTSLSERFATISDDYGNSTGKGLLTSLSERFATISDDYGNSTGKGLLTSLSERFATISDDYGNSTGKGSNKLQVNSPSLDVGIEPQTYFLTGRLFGLSEQIELLNKENFEIINLELRRKNGFVIKPEKSEEIEPFFIDDELTFVNYEELDKLLYDEPETLTVEEPTPLELHIIHLICQRISIIRGVITAIVNHLRIIFSGHTFHILYEFMKKDVTGLLKGFIRRAKTFLLSTKMNEELKEKKEIKEMKSKSPNCDQLGFKVLVNGLISA